MGTPKAGVISQGIRTPIIMPGDDLIEIVISSIVANVGEENIDDNDIIAVTEAVVAISQNNFATKEDIANDIAVKFAGVKKLAVVDPIQSRNRFEKVLEGIVAAPQLEEVYVFMTYPSDEVGNHLVSEEIIMESGVNPYKDFFTSEEFTRKFGKPRHIFTGNDYVENYINIDKKKVKVILTNDFSIVSNYCDAALVCSIHRSYATKKVLTKSGVGKVLDLSYILNNPTTKSGYNQRFGLYGSNRMKDNLKLMPRNCSEFVIKLQKEIKKRYGKDVEVMVYGDGAFKDPVGQIWELADPVTTISATKGLLGTPKEVKLKYLASANSDKSPEEIEEIVAKEKAARIQTGNLTTEASLGTTPRQITDLVASLADLTTGSGDRQTPVVLIKNYLS